MPRLGSHGSESKERVGDKHTAKPKCLQIGEFTVVGNLGRMIAEADFIDILFADAASIVAYLNAISAPIDHLKPSIRRLATDRQHVHRSKSHSRQARSL